MDTATQHLRQNAGSTPPPFFKSQRAADVPLPDWCDSHAGAEPRKVLSEFFDYKPTPLIELRRLSANLGLKGVWIKDEAQRFGLGSFKGLGGAYAVLQLARRYVEARLGKKVAASDLRSLESSRLLSAVTFSCASDGNHGRSVSAGAQAIGARAVIFLHEGVSEERTRHITDLGAETVLVKGDYAASVHAAAEAARASNWIAVPDTVGPEEDATACTLVVQGYAVMLDEVVQSMVHPLQPFTHAFIQAGVGGLAASVFGHGLACGLFDERTQLVIVEPTRSACLYESARAGRLVQIKQCEPTNMAMLECQSPSTLVFPLIDSLASAYMTVSDEEAIDAVRLLASRRMGDPEMRIGESGAAGLAGLIKGAMGMHRSTLRLDSNSRAFLIATEQPTDLATWSGAR